MEALMATCAVVMTCGGCVVRIVCSIDRDFFFEEEIRVLEDKRVAY